MNEQLNKLFELCPYNLLSEFERENFYAQTGVSSVRYIIEVINRIRKIDSDLLTETKPFETNCLKEEKNKFLNFPKIRPCDKIRVYNISKWLLIFHINVFILYEIVAHKLI